MDGGLIITLTSVAMFVGCFVLGLVPILFRLSEVSSVLIFPLFFSCISVCFPDCSVTLIETVTD